MPVRRIAPDDALLLRDVRLRALATDPRAFGSTYALEALRSPSAWETWAREHASGADNATFLALRDATANAVGLAMGKRMEEPRQFGLFSMWVDGAERRRGAGRELVEAVAAWVVASGGTHLRLWVTQPGARLFYERCGFVDDGRREPLAHSPDVIQIWMTRELLATSRHDREPSMGWESVTDREATAHEPALVCIVRRKADQGEEIARRGR